MTAPLDLLHLAVILVFGGMLRVLFILTSTTDNDWHLWKAKEAAQSPRAFDFSHRVSNAMAPGWHVYANLHHTILARFPRRSWLVTGKLLNIAYDLVGVVFLYAACHVFLLGPAAGERLGPLSAANVVALLYATTPILFPVTARFKSIGARVLGSLCALLYFGFLGYGLVEGSFAAYAAAGVCVLLAALASQFGLQAIVLFSLALAPLCASPAPVLVALGSLALGCLWPRLGIPRLLHGYADFYVHYWRNWRRGGTAMGRNKWKDVVQLPRLFRKKPEKAFRLCFEKLTPVIALTSVPLLGFWVYWGFTASGEIGGLIEASPAAGYCFAVSLCGLLYFTLTSIEPLVILGQAERYFTYSIAFMHVLSVQFLLTRPDGFTPLFFVLLLQLGFVLAHWTFIERDQLARIGERHLDPPFREVLDFLAARGGPRVLCVPTKHAWKISAELPDSDARFYYDHLTLEEGGRRYMHEERLHYNLLRGDLDHFVAKYGINLFVLRKDHIAKAAKQGIEYDLAARKLAFENDDYLIYEL